jgi:hypothetical protein
MHASLLAILDGVQDLFGTLRYRNDIDRGSRPHGTAYDCLDRWAPTNPDETVPDGTLTDPPADAPAVSGLPSDETSAAATPPRKAKPFGKKPKPADQNESVGVSNSSAAASDDSVGTPKPPKKRFDAPKKHRVTGSSSDTTGSMARSAPAFG